MCAHHPGVSSANTIPFCHITHNAQLAEQTCCYYDLSTSVEYTAARALGGAQSWGQSRGPRCSPGPVAEMAPYSAMEPDPMHLKGADLGPCFSMVQDKVQPNSQVHT